MDYELHPNPVENKEKQLERVGKAARRAVMSVVQSLRGRLE